MSVELLQGDCIEVMKTLPDTSFDSCVTDPPYHLTRIVKRFGGENAAPAKFGTDGAFARASAGFMGQKWDGGDIAFRPETWREVWRVLKPGAHLVAFSGTRTYHRMACAIEDAGFEIRDQLAWVYGSGFPKSHNLDGDWQGWGTALKPAWEPICLARKPLSEKTVAANVLAHGTGAINVDGCRIGTDGARNNGRKVDSDIYGKFGPTDRVDYGMGRWPSNLVHDGSDEVVAMFPDSKGQQGYVGPEHGARDTVNCYGDYGKRPPTPPRNDSGSAARFFYCAKASKSDRMEGNNHPTVKPTELMRWLCRLVTPPGGRILDPFMGSGSTGRGALREGCAFTGVELNPEYIEIARRRIGVPTSELLDVFA